jgi:two-component system, OmpR family, response regulator
LSVSTGAGVQPILVIEDEGRISSAIAELLDANGFETTTTTNGLVGLRQVVTGNFALVILDLLLPDLDGFSVLQTLKEQRPEQRVLVLSALSDTQSKVRCLELGACDFVSKPFEFAELLARVRVRLANGSYGSRYLRVGPIVLDLQRRVATREGRETVLSTREFVLLEYLMRKDGEVASREELLEHVWHYGFDPRTNVVEVCVARVRQKLGAACIETVRNVGYCYVGS